MESTLLSRYQQNFTRLAITCVDDIKFVFKDVFKSQIKPVDLENAINSCPTLTMGNQKLRTDQLKICRVPAPQVPDYDMFDVSLLYKLIRNLCPNLKPTKGWGNTPDTKELQIGDDIERLRLIRNEMFAHLHSSEIPDATFLSCWKELKEVIKRVQFFMTSLGYSVNYEKKLAITEVSDFCQEDMKKYKIFLEATLILWKENKEVPVIKVNGKSKIVYGEDAYIEAETERCPDNMNWPLTWERVRGGKTEIIDTSTEKYRGSSIKRLVIKRVEKADEGEYRAVISREMNGSHIYVPSNIFFLHALGDPPNLEITRATSGIDSVTILYTCFVEKTSPVLEKIEWTKDGELLRMAANKYEGGGIKDNYLKILSSSENDSGEYTCRVFNAVGSSVKRIVLAAPYVDIGKELTCPMGCEFTFNPVIKSCPSAEKAIWQKSKTQDSDNFKNIDINDARYFGSSLDPENPILRIWKTSHADNSYYRLEVTNGIGKSTSNAVLLKLVGDPPSVFTSLETNILSQDVKFLCKVYLTEGSPEVTKIFWTKDKQNLDISGSGGKYAGGSIADPSLVIHNVNVNDAGEYQCCVSNAVGSMLSYPIHLDKPTVQTKSFERDDESDRVICTVAIKSIPEALKTEWRVKKNPDDDFQPIDVYDSTYAGSTVSLPHPVLIVYGYSNKQGHEFQISVSNFIGETREIINEKKIRNEDCYQKAHNKQKDIYRKRGLKIPFANLRDDLESSFSQSEVKRFKHLLIDAEGQGIPDQESQKKIRQGDETGPGQILKRYAEKHHSGKTKRLYLGKTAASKQVIVAVIDSYENNEDTFEELPVLYRNWRESFTESKQAIHCKEAMANPMNHEEISQIETIISGNAEKLMSYHSNLEMISASPVKSMKQGKEIKVERCLVLYCTYKGIIPNGEEEFPHQIEGIKTDVREGFFYFCPRQGSQSHVFKSSMDYHHQLRMGCNIGKEDLMKTGTLGGFVKLNNNEIGFITCAHVLHPNLPLQDGDKTATFNVVQPGYGIMKRNEICGVHLKSLCPYTSTVDAALVKITNRMPDRGLFAGISFEDLENRGFDTDFPPEFQTGEIRDLRGTISREHRFTLCVKVGSSSRLTRGIINVKNASVKLDSYTLTEQSQNIVMHNLIEINPEAGHAFATAGDSGALVFQFETASRPENDKLVCIGMLVGVHMSGAALVMPIKKVLEELALPDTTRLFTFQHETMEQ
ncbi:uncharacterized protein LOC134231070 [Saccostrea cucullata]|uniref:uncharacterized protein LOC134231070 n=1 Tax=Saccostrea cuccullata TaxID=36930 RepID=UPI002ED3F5B6